MKIILNNRPEELEVDSLSVKSLLEEKNYTFKMLVVKINGVLIRKSAYDTTLVKSGDDVMVLHLVSGG